VDTLNQPATLDESANIRAKTTAGVRRLQLTASSLSAGYGVMFAVAAKIRDAYGMTNADIGRIIGIGFFASFIAQILLAPLADKGHARLLLVLGLGANLVGLVVMSVASSPWPFLLGRTVMGLGVGAAVPAIRRSIAVVDPDNVGKNMGGLNSFDVAGFLVGPALAAILVPHFGIRWPFAVAALISAISVPMTWSSPFGSAAEVTTPRLAVGLLRHGWMQASCLYGMAFFILIGTFDALWALRIADLKAPYYYVTVGILVFATPLLVLGEKGGRFVAKHGPFRTGLGGLALGAVLLSLYGLIDIPPLLIGIGLVHATNDGMTAASAPVAVAMTAPPEQQAGAQGLVGAAQTLTGGFASLIGGYLYGKAGPVATYGGASVAMLVFIVIGWFLAGAHRHRTVTPVAPAAPADAQVDAQVGAQVSTFGPATLT
jgi:predicted MFS family arabinose efflux permease